MSLRLVHCLKPNRGLVPFIFTQKTLVKHVGLFSCSLSVNKLLSDLTPTHIERHTLSQFHTSSARDYAKKKKKKSNYHKLNIKKIMADKEKWLEVGKYSVFPWTIAGIESCVVVYGENLKVAFDMGYAVRESVKCEHVFIR